MLLTIDKEKRHFCALCRIEDIHEGRGNAADKKSDVLLSYSVVKNGQREQVTDVVAFWNSQKESGRQMSNQIRKLNPGDYIVVIVSYKDSDHTALSFISGSGTFTFKKGTPGETNVILGAVGAVNNKECCQIGIPIGDDPKWHVVAYRDDLSQKAQAVVDRSKSVVAVTGPKRTEMTKAGKERFAYDGIRLYSAQKKDRTMITVGPFAKNPVPVSDVLCVPQEKKPEILAWLQFAVEKWEPEESLLPQKEALRKIYEEVQGR
jgi:hypothetical protein